MGLMVRYRRKRGGMIQECISELMEVIDDAQDAASDLENGAKTPSLMAALSSIDDLIWDLEQLEVDVEDKDLTREFLAATVGNIIGKLNELRSDIDEADSEIEDVDVTVAKAVDVAESIPDTLEPTLALLQAIELYGYRKAMKFAKLNTL